METAVENGVEKMAFVFLFRFTIVNRLHINNACPLFCIEQTILCVILIKRNSSKLEKDEK